MLQFKNFNFTEMELNSIFNSKIKRPTQDTSSIYEIPESIRKVCTIYNITFFGPKYDSLHLFSLIVGRIHKKGKASKTR